jgi:3-dehydroquinate synthase
MELLASSERESIETAIASVGKLPSANTIAPSDIISAIHRDKKVEAGRAHFVLPLEIGRVAIRSDVPPQVIREALKDVLA